MMKTRLHPQKSRAQRGFTLVETLVAIAILMIALVGPYFSVEQAIVISFAARDQLIATQLAQEGEEYIHFRRDSNFLSSAAWTNGLDACFGSTGCTVDPSQGTLAACAVSGCTPLKLATNGFYTQTGSYPVTRFTRTVKLTTLNANEMQVAVTVTWITEHRSYTVTTVDDLYNWL